MDFTGHEQKLSNLRRLYGEWDSIRRRGWYNRWIKSLPTPVAFFTRAMIRVLFLGHAYSKQSDLLKCLIDIVTDLDSQQRSLAEKLVEVQVAVQEQGRALAALESAVQEQGRALAALESAVQEQGRALAALETESHRAIQHLQEAVDHQQRILISYDRFRDYMAFIRHNGAEKSWFLSPEEAVALIRSLEVDVPLLSRCDSVDISVRGKHMSNIEGVVIALSQYFDYRLSSSSDPYRYPNDIWICILELGDVDLVSIFEEASSRLMVDGYFVLIHGDDIDFIDVVHRWKLIKKKELANNGRSLTVTVYQKLNDELLNDQCTSSGDVAES